MKALYTSALIPLKYEERKNDYQKSYNNLIKHFKKEDIFIIECFSDKTEFLNEFGSDVLLTNTHNPDIKNKGVLEIMGINYFLKNKNLKEDELIMKITGRYKLNDDHFLKTAETFRGFDFYGKLIDNNSQIFTGCFIIKNSIFIEFINSQDIDYLEKNMINIEKSLFNFLQLNNKKCLFVDNLNITAPIFGKGNTQIVVL